MAPVFTQPETQSGFDKRLVPLSELFSDSAVRRFKLPPIQSTHGRNAGQRAGDKGFIGRHRFCQREIIHPHRQAVGAPSGG